MAKITKKTPKSIISPELFTDEALDSFLAKIDGWLKTELVDVTWDELFEWLPPGWKKNPGEGIAMFLKEYPDAVIERAYIKSGLLRIELKNPEQYGHVFHSVVHQYFQQIAAFSSVTCMITGLRAKRRKDLEGKPCLDADYQLIYAAALDRAGRINPETINNHMGKTSHGKVNSTD